MPHDVPVGHDIACREYTVANYRPTCCLYRYCGVLNTETIKYHVQVLPSCNSKQQHPSWEVNSHIASQDIPEYLFYEIISFINLTYQLFVSVV
jgi:hypothetical protein